MTSGPDPFEHGWWLASRASGIVALLCVTLSVALGLAIAGRVAADPARVRGLLALHRQAALAGLVLIAVHGICLLGDRFLDPGPLGIAVPFVIPHARPWTGLGVSAGWLAALLGLSYWARDRIGAALWRRLHRATILVYALSVAHVLGAGTDGGRAWMLVLLVATGAPVLFLLVLRLLPAPQRSALRRFRVAGVTPESADVTSLTLEPADGRPVEPHQPGQFVTVALELPGAGRSVRTYSVSGPPDPGSRRISVKRDGACSSRLHALVPGDAIELGAPAGGFVLDRDSNGAVVLLSAGVGATPLLAMLHDLAGAVSPREVWWVHGARCGREHAFRAEARALVARLPHGRLHVSYSRPEPRDRDHDATGRLTAERVLGLGIPPGAEYYVCGPGQFLDELCAGLEAAGVPAERIRSERFTPPPTARSPRAGAPAAVGFSRSGVRATWDARYPALLDLAEASGVAAAAGCRVGACHSCRTAVLAGMVTHDPPPAAPPPPGSALLCCAQPAGDVVLDA